MYIEEERTKAMKFAMKLLGLRRRSEKELLKRLEEKGYKDDIAQEVMAEMQRFGYLDDSQFAESYINDRMRFRPAGRFVIRMELKGRGLSDSVIEEKLDELLPREEELRLASSLAEKKLRTLDRRDEKKARLKLLNFLKSKGFSSDIISQAVKNHIKSD
jgi:regulatory protein